MSSRRIVAAALWAFVAVSIATIVVQELDRDGTTEAAPQAKQGTVLIAYYFHGNRRCVTCNSIEKLAREVIEGKFTDECARGRIAWRTVNFEEPANARFREDYGLYTSTLVLSDVRDGVERDWYELDEVWQFVGDKSAFVDYVTRETRAVLEGTP